ncbi:MAG TPA: endospore germination permease [Syntrophomonadaceae bacterium]|nr:endospore germination permease [Syntrophomonadaceae bacterium]
MINRMSSQQLAFLVFLLMLGSALIYVPESMTRQDAWISSLLASLVGLYILWAILFIQKKYPGISIFKISEVVLGRITGKIFNAFYVWLLIVVSMLYLYDIAAFLMLIFPDLPYSILYAIVLLLAAYLLYQGPGIIGRLGESLVFLTLFLVLLGLGMTATSAQWSNLSPVLSDWKPVLAGAIYGANWPYAEVSAFALFLPLLNDLQEKSHKIYIWYLIAVIVLVLRSVMVIATLGPEYTQLSRFPLFSSMRLVRFTHFQRVELFFILLWFITGFSAIAIFYQSLMLALKDFFKLRTYRPLILPTAALLIALCQCSFAANTTFLQFETSVVTFHSLPIHLIYVSAVLLGVVIHPRLTGSG